MNQLICTILIFDAIKYEILLLERNLRVRGKFKKNQDSFRILLIPINVSKFLKCKSRCFEDSLIITTLDMQKYITMCRWVIIQMKHNESAGHLTSLTHKFRLPPL